MRNIKCVQSFDWSFKWPYHVSNLNSMLSLNNIMNITTYWPPNSPYRSTNCNYWQPNRSLDWKSPENFMRFPQKALEVLKIRRNTRQMFHPYPYTAPVLSCSSSRLQLPLHSTHCPQHHSNLQIVGLYPLIHFIHFSHLFSLAVAAMNGRLSTLGNKSVAKSLMLGRVEPTAVDAKSIFDR